MYYLWFVLVAVHVSLLLYSMNQFFLIVERAVHMADLEGMVDILLIADMYKHRTRG